MTSMVVSCESWPASSKEVEGSSISTLRGEGDERGGGCLSRCPCYLRVACTGGALAPSVSHCARPCARRWLLSSRRNLFAVPGPERLWEFAPSAGLVVTAALSPA